MPQPNTQPSQITPELHATLNAWRELGPDYDDQFITAVVDQLGQRPTRLEGQAHGPLTSTPKQRHALAIISVVLLLGMAIPIAAVGGGMGLVAVSLAVVAVNLIFGLPEVTRRPARRTRR